jgi:hypothetical protein
MKKYLKVGETADKKKVYFGKKDSSDPESPNLSLWITVGIPKKDASNYHRVPGEWESTYLDNRWSTNEWTQWLETKIQATTSKEIKGWKTCL